MVSLMTLLAVLSNFPAFKSQYHYASMHTSLFLSSFVFCLPSNVNLCSLFITWREIDLRATNRNWIIFFEGSADISVHWG